MKDFLNGLLGIFGGIVGCVFYLFSSFIWAIAVIIVVGLLINLIF